MSWLSRMLRKNLFYEDAQAHPLAAKLVILGGVLYVLIFTAGMIYLVHRNHGWK
jgi:hypothetical protein